MVTLGGSYFPSTAVWISLAVLLCQEVELLVWQEEKQSMTLLQKYADIKTTRIWGLGLIVRCFWDALRDGLGFGCKQKVTPSTHCFLVVFLTTKKKLYKIISKPYSTEGTEESIRWAGGDRHGDTLIEIQLFQASFYGASWKKENKMLLEQLYIWKVHMPCSYIPIMFNSQNVLSVLWDSV